MNQFLLSKIQWFVPLIYYQKQIAHLYQWKLQQDLNKKDNNSSTVNNNNLVQIRFLDRILYGYCMLMVFRYLVSSFTIQKGVEVYYFRYDIVMEIVRTKGHFDEICFILVAFILTYAAIVHYFRNYVTNLNIVSKQYHLIHDSCNEFWYHHPELKVSFESRRNYLKLLILIPIRLIQIYSRMNTFSSIRHYSRQLQQQNKTTTTIMMMMNTTSNNKTNNLPSLSVKEHARLVILVLSIELMNLVVFLLLSK